MINIPYNIMWVLIQSLGESLRCLSRHQSLRQPTQLPALTYSDHTEKQHPIPKVIDEEQIPFTAAYHRLLSADLLV